MAENLQLPCVLVSPASEPVDLPAQRRYPGAMRISWMKRVGIVGLYRTDSPDKTHEAGPLRANNAQLQTPTEHSPSFGLSSMLDGKVIGDYVPRDRHQEFIRFLKRIDTETPNVKKRRSRYG